MYKTIGHSRDDGDLDLIATLNNSGGHLTPEAFRQLHSIIVGFVAERTHIDLVTLDRQDAPDVIAVCE